MAATTTSSPTRPVGVRRERRDWAAVGRALRTYDPMPPGERAFAAARYAIAPLGPLTTELGGVSGRVLSLGSGLCMVERYLAEVNADVHFEGIDLDGRKVELIEATRALSPRVAVVQGDATLLDGRSGYDAVLVCDALHHLPLATHARLAADIAQVLAPGGICVVKDLDLHPRWKYAWNRVHDRVVAGPEPLSCRTVDGMARLLASAGLEVERAERTERPWEPYAHYIVVARRPG